MLAPCGVFAYINVVKYNKTSRLFIITTFSEHVKERACKTKEHFSELVKQNYVKKHHNFTLMQCAQNVTIAFNTIYFKCDLSRQATLVGFFAIETTF